MNWGEYRLRRDACVASFDLSESDSERLRRAFDDCRGEALNEALDWLESESQSVCLTKEAAKKSWGMK